MQPFGPGRFSEQSLKMADEKVLALDERLNKLEQRVFGAAEKDAEYPKVWNCCSGSCFRGS